MTAYRPGGSGSSTSATDCAGAWLTNIRAAAATTNSNLRERTRPDSIASLVRSFRPARGVGSAGICLAAVLYSEPGYGNDRRSECQRAFAGLAPVSAGLYQVNAIVPPGVAGVAVPVVLVAAGQASPAVTISVH